MLLKASEMDIELVEVLQKGPSGVPSVIFAKALTSLGKHLRP